MLDGFGMAGAARSCKLAGVLGLFHLHWFAWDFAASQDPKEASKTTKTIR